jgi:hypothetical protein
MLNPMAMLTWHTRRTSCLGAEVVRKKTNKRLKVLLLRATVLPIDPFAPRPAMSFIPGQEVDVLFAEPSKKQLRVLERRRHGAALDEAVDHR